MKITMPQPVAEIKYGGYASGNELVWTKGAGLQFLPAGTKLYAASVHAPTPVAYLDVGAGGYMYLGTDLTEDQVGSFPWGRHTLAIVGTYGADGYVPAEWPFDYAEAYQVAQQDLAIWKRRALEAELRVRDQDQIIDRMGDDLNAINGPTFMGGPLLPKQSAAPAPVERVEQEAKVFWVLFDNTTDVKYIKKDSDAGTLAFFDNEKDAARAKRFNPGTDYKRLEYYTAPQPAPTAAQDVAGLEFTLMHPADGETHTIMLTRQEIQERMTDELYEKLGKLICHCEPVGETNVVDCNCIDRIDEFHVVANQSGGAK